jgi:hypothetical protein
MARWRSSGSQLGLGLPICAVGRRRTVPSRIPFAPLPTLLTGISDSFVPCLDSVLAGRFGLVFATGCHHLTTPCPNGWCGSADG